MQKQTKPNNTSVVRHTRKLEDKSPKRESLIVFSFRDFDTSQGQTFKEWEDNKILSKALEKLRSLSNLTKVEAVSNKILKQYNKVSFPPKSKFEPPKHIPVGTIWASFHIQGKECIIGHFEDNIFHIVFLDKDHEFWISEKKHT